MQNGISTTMLMCMETVMLSTAIEILAGRVWQVISKIHSQSFIHSIKKWQVCSLIKRDDEVEERWITGEKGEFLE